MKNTLISLLLPSLFFFSCTSPPTLEQKISSSPKIKRVISGERYEQHGLQLAQTDGKEKHNFLIISDIHNQKENLAKILEKTQNQYDAIIVLGDICYRSPSKSQIKSNIEIIAQTNTPILVLPGNHDIKRFENIPGENLKPYENVMYELGQKYPNIIDMRKIRILDGKGFNIVSYPYIPPKNLHELKEAKEIIGDTDITILASHYAPRCKGPLGIDMELFNIGSINPDLFPVSVSGHSHLAGGKACTSLGDIIPQNKYVTELKLNPGSIVGYTNWLGEKVKASVAILRIKNNKASYEIIKVD